MRKSFYFLILIAFFYSCTQPQPLKIFNLKNTAHQKVSFKAKAGETIDLYTVFKASYKEPFEMVYDFKLYDEYQLLLNGGVDPFECENYEYLDKKTKNDTTKLSMKGKLAGNFMLSKNGIYTIEVNIAANRKQIVNIDSLSVILVKY